MAGVVHGGRLDAAISIHGGKPEDWIDLSTGINPHAYPVSELDDRVWQRLPDEHAHRKLEEAARQYYRVGESSAIVAANGTQAIIQILPQLISSKSVGIVSPTYGEHEYCWRNSDAAVELYISLSEALGKSDVVVVVNPNNPDGRTYRPDQLEEAAGILASRSGFLIVDEAFGDVMPELSIVPHLPGNTIVLRSFGKFFGLAGLRLGFSICAREIVDQMVKAFGPWSVSGPALAIGLQALSDQDWISGMKTKIEVQSLKQADEISSCGLNLVANTCLFMEFEVEDGMALSQSLMTEHILVRSFPDRPNRLRFGLCKDDLELDRLSSALKKHV